MQGDEDPEEELEGKSSSDKKSSGDGGGSDKSDDEICDLLKTVADFCEREDEAVRLRQIRQWRKLKLYWNGFQRLWDDGVAHDWRVFNNDETGDYDAAYYDKPINIFRAYLESIIAALSISIPQITCLPDNASNSLDIATAKAGDKISKLVYRHNNAALLWLNSLYILVTEGMVACYSYPKEDPSYGTYKEPKTEKVEGEGYQCQFCQTPLPDDIHAQVGTFNDRERDEYMPGDDDILMQNTIKEGPVCPECGKMIDPSLQKTSIIIEKIVGVTEKNKTRVCLEMYGGLSVKIPNYARIQKDCPYLRLAREINYVSAIEKYPELYDKLGSNIIRARGMGGWGVDEYERWGRLNTQYMGDYPINTVTERIFWFRPEVFNCLPEDDCKKLKKKYPNGCKAVFINEDFAESENEALDDCWTLSLNPLADFLHHEPMGALGVSVQDITNDLIALTLQTVEQGIPQTFVDPSVFDLEAYRNQEASPGTIYPTKAVNASKNLNESFVTLKTAQLSTEVLPFGKTVQDLGQLALGALPSLFGGMAEAGSKTASEYSMSRSQALQRQQNTWRMMTYWWKEIFGKVIPMFIKEMVEDEHYSERNPHGDYVQVLIMKAETEGKIGEIELEPNENLPMTQTQKKEVLMQLMQFAHPALQQILTDPNNLGVIADAIGLPELTVPGNEDRIKQHDEIKELLESEPITEQEPSVPVDQILDNHAIEAEVCRSFLISEEGRMAKVQNPLGYLNVMLHMKQHMFIQTQNMMQAEMKAQQQQSPDDSKGKKPNGKAGPPSSPEEKGNTEEMNYGPIQ